MSTEPRIYGVSSGNGDDGVSHMFADYYVKTDKPWLLAQAAMLAEFKPGKGQEFALNQLQIDGEPEYCLSAVIHDPPNDDGEEELCDDGSSWSESNGAWLIVEVFPEDEPRDGRPTYDSLEECFDAALLALCDKE